MARIISCGDPRGMLQCSFCLKNFRLGSQWVAQAGNLWCWKCLNASKLKNNGFYSKPNPKFLFKTLHCIRCKTAFKHKSTLHSSACAPFCKVCFKHNEISYKLKCADDSSRKTEINCEGINQAHAQTICKGLKTHDRILLKNVSINKDEQVLDNSIHVCQSNNWYRKPYYDKDLVDFNKLKLVHKVNGSSLVNCNDTSHVPLHDKQGLNTFTGDLSASSDHQVYGGRVDKVPTSHITALCGNDVNENVNLKHNGMAHHSAGTTNFNFIQNNDFSHVQLICTFCNKKFSSSDGFCVMSGDIKCHSCVGGGSIMVAHILIMYYQLMYVPASLGWWLAAPASHLILCMVLQTNPLYILTFLGDAETTSARLSISSAVIVASIYIVNMDSLLLRKKFTVIIASIQVHIILSAPYAVISAPPTSM